MGKESYKKMLLDSRWVTTRNRINSYAGGRCEYCGERTQHPEVHHEKYEGVHPSDTRDEHLKSLCRECHYETHWIRRLRLYSKRKRELYEAGVWIGPVMHQKLIKEFRV